MCSSYVHSAILFRAEKNNSVKLMIVGMHRRGKTTLLERLKGEGRFQDSFYPDVGRVPSPPPGNTGNTVGIKIGIWSYSKYRDDPSYPEIEFYTWDYAGEVRLVDTCFFISIKSMFSLSMLQHRRNTTPLISYSFTLVLSTLWCGTCWMVMMECTAFYHGCKGYT